MKKCSTLFLALFLWMGLNAQTPLLSEDFEGGIPADWTADASWETGTSGALSSQFFTIPPHTNIAGVNDDAAGQGVSSDGMLMTPAIDLSEVAGAVLTFDAFFGDGDYGGDETAKVLVSNDAGATWNEEASLSGNFEEWQSIFLNISAYAGDTILIAFDYKDGGAWNYGYCVDDVVVFAPPAYDAAMVNVSTTRFHELNSAITIEGAFQNLGTETITSLTINWSDGTNTYSEDLTGLNIVTGESYDFTHGTSFTATEAITYDIDVWVSAPNGQADEDSANDMAVTKVSGVTFVPAKKVVVEEGTGGWCGWCPRGHVAMEYMRETFPETFIGIAVHNGDAMVVSQYDNNVGLTGYPGCNADRVLLDVSVSTQDFQAYHNQLVQRIAPVKPSIQAVFNPDNRIANIDVSAEFVTKLDDIDYRFSVVIVQDSVTGSGSGYNQTNYYSFEVNNLPLVGAGHDWQAAPDPVLAADMVYMDVARALLGGYNGTANVIPSSVVAGDVASNSYNYVVPVAYNIENMHAVLLLLDGSTGQILNAESTEFEVMINTSRDEFANELVDIFPNPTQGELNIAVSLENAADIQLQVYNMLGQQVASQDFGRRNGSMTLPFDGSQLAAGAYTFHITMGDKVAVKKVVVE